MFEFFTQGIENLIPMAFDILQPTVRSNDRYHILPMSTDRFHHSHASFSPLLRLPFSPPKAVEVIDFNRSMLDVGLCKKIIDQSRMSVSPPDRPQ